MKNIPNKVVALITLGAWSFILLVSLVNGFLYGSPPIDNILPPIVAALFGWFAFIITIYAVVRLLKSPDGSVSQNGGGMSM